MHSEFDGVLRPLIQQVTCHDERGALPNPHVTCHICHACLQVAMDCSWDVIGASDTGCKVLNLPDCDIQRYASVLQTICKRSLWLPAIECVPLPAVSVRIHPLRSLVSHLIITPHPDPQDRSDTQSPSVLPPPLHPPHPHPLLSEPPPPRPHRLTSAPRALPLDLVTDRRPQCDHSGSPVSRLAASLAWPLVPTVTSARRASGLREG